MANNVKGFLKLLFASSANEVIQTKPDDRLVAAGNPAKQLSTFNDDFLLSPEDRQQLHGLRQFKVCGSSMSPCGIANGDFVYAEVIEDDLHCDDFIIVAVDPKVYDIPIKFVHKLRRYLMDVPRNENLEEIVNRLKKFHKEILEPEFQERLKKKFNKTKGFYPNDDLCLSITFRDGDLRYSFHPRRLVEYRVKFTVSLQNQNLVNVSDLAAY